jgi:fluoride exporter
VTVEPTWLGYLLVALGGGLGAAVRYLAGHAWDRPGAVPTGTVAVNLLGSLLLGVLTGAAVGGAAAAVAGLGFCGALTTYSSFVVQAHDRGRRVGALTVLLTVVPALASYAAGSWLGALSG